MRNWPIFIFILLTIFSCGKTTDEETEDVVLQANIELGQSNCQNAIDILEGYGRQMKNYKYVKALASAYACRGGYSSITFFTDDLAATTSPAPLGGISTYTTSDPTFQVPLEYDPRFVDLQTAINILLYAGGIASTTEPTTTERAKYFTTSQLGDLHTELMFMELVQLGRIIKVYGNVSVAGVKGGGTSGNNCLTSYSVSGITPSSAGACNSTNSAHSQTDKLTLNDEVVRKRRLCHGVVLMNGFLELLPAVIDTVFPATSGSRAAVDAALTAINLAKTAAGSIGQVLNTQNQSSCEDNAIVSVSNLEAYYAFIMERSFL